MAYKNYDDEDVKAALENSNTADGPGFEVEDDLPESDFDGFAQDDVENEENDK